MLFRIYEVLPAKTEEQKSEVGLGMRLSFVPSLLCVCVCVYVCVCVQFEVVEVATPFPLWPRWDEARDVNRSTCVPFPQLVHTSQSERSRAVRVFI